MHMSMAGSASHARCHMMQHIAAKQPAYTRPVNSSRRLFSLRAPMLQECSGRPCAAALTRCRCSASDFEYVGVPHEEVGRFERIAASLAGMLPAEGSGHLDEDMQQQDQVHKQASSDGSSSSSGSKRKKANQPGVSHALGGDGYVPRSQRKPSQIPTQHLPKVALVGRPNVGKSALFNRVAGASLAVVYDEPGVTRDRLYARAFWGDKEFVLIDTGGLMSDATRLSTEVQRAAMHSISAEGLPAAIERQAAAGVAEADAVVLIVDGQEGLQPGDREILMWLRTMHSSKAVTLVVNKCENSRQADMMAAEFWELGMLPHPVSAITGAGTGDMLDSMIVGLPPPRSLSAEEDTSALLSVAIVGRPNVGKSSLLNAVCGEERSIVCDLSGTTRDAIDIELRLPTGKRMKLVDTAGIRKRTKVAGAKEGAEQLSVDRALRAIRRADVVVHVIDASEGITQQDFKLVQFAAGEGCALVIVANKWDKVDHQAWTPATFSESIRTQLRQASWAHVVCTTATKGTRVQSVMDKVLAAAEQHSRRVSTATLNLVVKDATSWKAPPAQRGLLHRGKIYFATQASTKPPTFVFFVNDTKVFPDDYKRYMERQLRDQLGFEGTALRFIWRGKPERDPRHITTSSQRGR